MAVPVVLQSAMMLRVCVCVCVSLSLTLLKIIETKARVCCRTVDHCLLTVDSRRDVIV